MTAEIRAALSDSGLGHAPVIAVSAVTGEGIENLRRALATAETETAAHNNAGLLRLAVDRSFTLSGAVTVVTGMVLGNRVKLDDTVIVRADPPACAASMRRTGRPQKRLPANAVR
ncbi:hypothetical protein [Sinorhizobium sp. GL28]|uniref:hypothetical protein n=1 Tax=Sinorhizobium sp. GL28 TaxID=1358418 RepID=UPI00071E2DE1